MEKIMVFSPKGRIQGLIDQYGPYHEFVIKMLEIYGSDGGEFVPIEEPKTSVINRGDPPQEKCS